MQATLPSAILHQAITVQPAWPVTIFAPVVAVGRARHHKIFLIHKTVQESLYRFYFNNLMLDSSVIKCYNNSMTTSLPPQTDTKPVPPPLTPEQIAAQKAQEQQTRSIIVSVSVIGVVILALLITAIYFLLRPETPADVVAKIRDVFIIVVGLETLIIGVALVVLLIQLASLINLLQNEVRPIIQATNETVNTLRGTAEFLSKNAVEPIVKLNGYLASIQRVLELMGVKRK